MNCPHCQHPTTTVTDSRPYNGGIRRRRRCERCLKRFSTLEQVHQFEITGRPANAATLTGPGDADTIKGATKSPSPNGKAHSTKARRDIQREIKEALQRARMKLASEVDDEEDWSLLDD